MITTTLEGLKIILEKGIIFIDLLLSVRIRGEKVIFWHCDAIITEEIGYFKNAEILEE